MRMSVTRHQPDSDYPYYAEVRDKSKPEEGWERIVAIGGKKTVPDAKGACKTHLWIINNHAWRNFVYRVVDIRDGRVVAESASTGSWRMRWNSHGQ